MTGKPFRHVTEIRATVDPARARRREPRHHHLTPATAARLVAARPDVEVDVADPRQDRHDDDRYGTVDE
ncbi:hypothetical protein [Plantactinospora sonchi]|uniref:Uncharacterized protein n=1 Tax=Plantactinospora sonchi TaxID=1544735 RepID=A0ABU7S4J5_9ACTN